MPRKIDAPPEVPNPRRSDSVAIVHAIMGAARELVAQGMEGFTMDAVARRAGVGPASLYRYFPDKAALVTELFRLQHVDVMERMEDAVALGATLEEKVHACVAAYIEWDERELELRRVLNFEVPPAWTLEQRAAATRRIYETFGQHAARAAPSISGPVLQDRMFYALSLMLGAGQLRMLVPEVAPEGGQLVAVLTNMVMRGLLDDPEEARNKDQKRLSRR